MQITDVLKALKEWRIVHPSKPGECLMSFEILENGYCCVNGDFGPGIEMETIPTLQELEDILNNLG